MTKDRLLLVAGAMALLAYAALLAFRIDGDAVWGTHVFGSLWASGDAANRGFDPFATYALTPVNDLGAVVIPENNLNPPVLLPVLQAVALFDPHVAARVWLMVSALICIGTVAMLARRGTARLPLLWALSNFMILNSLLLGQIYSVLFALAAAMWLFLGRGQPRAAGLALGLLVAIKPNFGLALVILALAGHRHVAGQGAAVALLFSLLPLALYGPDVYGLWLAAVRDDLHWVYWADASLIGFASRIGAPPLGFVGAAVLAVVCVAIVRRPRATLADAVYLGLAASILCSPLAWFHYLLVLVPALIERRWRYGEWAVAIALMIPLETIIAHVPDAIGSAWLKGYYVAVACALVALRIGPLIAPATAQARRPHLGDASSAPHPSAVVPERRQMDAGRAALS